MNMGPFVKTSIGLAVALSVCVPRVTTAAAMAGLKPCATRAVVAELTCSDVAQAFRPAAFTGPTALTAAEEQADVVYVQARDLIEQGRFDAAIDRLNQLIAEKSSRTDAALYWRAYSLAKIGQRADALSTLEDLRSSLRGAGGAATRERSKSSSGRPRARPSRQIRRQTMR